MRTFVFCVALLGALNAGYLRAGTISRPALAKMGLAGVQRLSDAEGRSVRGSPYLFVPGDGGAFQVILAHSYAEQYNFLPTSGFANGAFTPLQVPLSGGVGGRGR
jgi:hypothetical protein